MRLVTDFPVAIENQPVAVAGHERAEYAVVKPLCENVRAEAAALAPPPLGGKDEEVEAVQDQTQLATRFSVDLPSRKRVRVPCFARDHIDCRLRHENVGVQETEIPAAAHRRRTGQGVEQLRHDRSTTDG